MEYHDSLRRAMDPPQYLRGMREWSSVLYGSVSGMVDSIEVKGTSLKTRGCPLGVKGTAQILTALTGIEKKLPTTPFMASGADVQGSPL
ncbi:hypothetical protein CRG98_042092 [Punica granatum]|uniref:Uncharacterized protein n=1 Tax=Punica granatum TaxID=22663 RepID=A0A2I0I0Z6_PUNGR|nr:hypothetical protein CRG98_042092 [Punica granatum]